MRITDLLVEGVSLRTTHVSCGLSLLFVLVMWLPRSYRVDTSCESHRRRDFFSLSAGGAERVGVRWGILEAAPKATAREALSSRCLGASRVYEAQGLCGRHTHLTPTLSPLKAGQSHLARLLPFSPLSFPRKRESSAPKPVTRPWIPACAGMTATERPENPNENALPLGGN
jgi:hypothetical protein